MTRLHDGHEIIHHYSKLQHAAVLDMDGCSTDSTIVGPCTREAMKTNTRGLRLLAQRLKGPTARKGFLSVIDQALVSGNTFITNLICVRVLSKEEYGVFAILFTIYLFLNHFQSALVTWPLSVLSKGREAEEEGRYLGSTFLHQVVISGAVALLLFVAAGALWLVGVGNIGFSSGLMTLGVVIIPLQFLEYVRRLFFMKMDPRRTLYADVAFVASNLFLVFLIVLGLRGGFIDGQVLSPALFLGTLGIGAAVACVFAFGRARQYHTFGGVRYSDSMKENWGFGKWHLGYYAGSAGMVQVNTWIIGAMGGVVAVGAVESARLLLAPLYLFSQGLGNFVVPLMSEKYASGGAERLRQSFWHLYPFWILLMLGYCSVILVAPQFWIELLLGKQYAGSESFVLMWTGIMFLAAVLTLPQWTLLAMRRPDAVMHATLWGGAAVVPCTFIFMYLGGAVMGLGARLVGEIVAFGFTAWFLRKHLLKNPVG